MPATREEVERIKRSWKDDPCWDLTDLCSSEEYALYANELRLFQMTCEAAWEQQRIDRLTEKADAMGVPGNLNLARYIESIERRLAELERTIDGAP